MTVETSIGKITASKDVLNWIVGAFEEQAMHNREKGNRNALADFYNGISWEIYNSLKKTGYYE